MMLEWKENVLREVSKLPHLRACGTESIQSALSHGHSYCGATAAVHSGNSVTKAVANSQSSR